MCSACFSLLLPLVLKPPIEFALIDENRQPVHLTEDQHSAHRCLIASRARPNPNCRLSAGTASRPSTTVRRNAHEHCAGAVADRGFKANVVRGPSDVAGCTTANLLGGPVDLAALALTLRQASGVTIFRTTPIVMSVPKEGAVYLVKRLCASPADKLVLPSANIDVVRVC